MYKKFEKWMNSLLAEHTGEGIVAYNFNIYEGEEEGDYDLQLIGASMYDAEDDDWACSEVYSSGEDIFSYEAEDWEAGLDVCIDLVKQYLEQGKYADVLKKGKVVTTGFVDGDLELIYE